MTTIIGIQGDGWTVIGADSKISAFGEDGFISGQSLLPAGSSKLVDKDGYILGAAGDVRAINLLHHVFEPPNARYATTPQKVDHHITKRFIPALRQCFDAEGFSPPDSEKREHRAEHSSTIIVSVKARLYIIENDYSWTQDAAGVYAIGTGDQYARGALHLLTKGGATKLNQEKAIAIVSKALEVAGCYDPYTGGPNHIFTQKVDQ